MNVNWIARKDRFTSVCFAGEKQVVPFIQRPGYNTQLLLQTIQDHYGRRRICKNIQKIKKSNLISKASKREGRLEPLCYYINTATNRFLWAGARFYVWLAHEKSIIAGSIRNVCTNTHTHTGYDDGSTLWSYIHINIRKTNIAWAARRTTLYTRRVICLPRDIWGDRHFSRLRKPYQVMYMYNRPRDGSVTQRNRIFIRDSLFWMM